METAIGRSKRVPIFLISDGARLRMIFFCGRSTQTFLSVALILSLASLIAASGSHTISMVGTALDVSASTITS